MILDSSGKPMGAKPPRQTPKRGMPAVHTAKGVPFTRKELKRIRDGLKRYEGSAHAKRAEVIPLADINSILSR